MTAASSSGRAARPSAQPSTISATPWPAAISLRPIGVSTTPGDTETMRAPRAPQAGAVRRTMRITPSFDMA